LAALLGGLSDGTAYACNVRALNPFGAGPASATVTFTPGAAPAITSAAPAGGPVNVAYLHAFVASGAPLPMFQLTTGALPPGLDLDPTTGILAGTPTVAGTYTGAVTVANDLGSAAQSFSITITPPDPANPARLANISTRGMVLTGNGVMIGGFIIGGTTPKTVVVRARGPSLIPLGITNALANPTLTLVRSSDQAVVATNDNWGGAANAAAISASGFAPSHALESAILVTLPPGAYTAIVAGAGGATGVGTIELFEVDQPQASLINISTRGQVLTGNDVMIGGFIIQGSAPLTVVVRARGPSLAPLGIANALMNPSLTLVRSSDNTVIDVNDNWASAANAAQLTASGFAPSNSLESAILITLPPGAYTAIVTGVGGATGVGTVEVFALP
jgi:hypothetical protein